MVFYQYDDLSQFINLMANYIGLILQPISMSKKSHLYGGVMWHKKILKIESSEWIVRNSLYWMSSFCRWKLDQNDDCWLITFDAFSDEIQYEFERLLNDYSLREKLHAQTYRVRSSIIDNVLKSIDARLTK